MEVVTVKNNINPDMKIFKLIITSETNKTKWFYLLHLNIHCKKNLFLF